MIDILGAVNDFILQYVHTDGMQPLSQSQIIRSWQNYGGLPARSQEVAILSLLGSFRHGTNIHSYEDVKDAPTGLTETISELEEHTVQVDFCAGRPRIPETVPRTRAKILEVLARDAIGIQFFKRYGLSSCYADNVTPMPFTNESQQLINRYTVTLHLSGWAHIPVKIDSFEDVNLYIENVDVHHPIQKQGD